MRVERRDTLAAQLAQCFLQIVRRAVLDEYLELIHYERVAGALQRRPLPREGCADERLENEHPNRARQPTKRHVRQRDKHDQVLVNRIEQIQ